MRIPFVKKDTAVADAKALLDRLNAKLAETVAAEAASDETIQRLYATNANDAEIAKAEEKHLGITVRREHLLDAVTAAEMKLDAAKKAAADVLDRKQRDTTIARLRSEREKDIPAFKREFDALCARGAALFRGVALHTAEAAAVQHFMEAAPRDIDAVLGMVIRGIDGLEKMVDCGNAPATIRSPDEPAPRPQPAPAPTTTRRIAMTDVAWTDDVGHIRFGQRGYEIDLPIEIANRALERGICLIPNDGRARAIEAGKTSRRPINLASAVPLDDGAAKMKAELTGQDEKVPELPTPTKKPAAVTYAAQPPHAEKITHSQFTPLDRGKPYAAQIAATRSAFDE